MSNPQNKIDTKIKELENQSEPDLSQMEKHWQQMKYTLKSSPHSGINGKGWLRNPFRLLTVLGILGVSAIVFYEYNNIASEQDNKNAPLIAITQTIQEPDTIPTMTRDTAIPARKSASMKRKYAAKSTIARDSTRVQPIRKSVRAAAVDTATRAKPVKRKSTPVSDPDSILLIKTITKTAGYDTLKLYSANEKAAPVFFLKTSTTTTKDTTFIRLKKNKHVRYDTIAVEFKDSNKSINSNKKASIKFKRSNTQNSNNNISLSIDSSKILLLEDTSEFSSLEDVLRLPQFKNKLVFVDLWGTRCAPCINEFAHLDELKKRYKGKPVAFLYLKAPYGFDDHKEWKDMARKYRLEGVNVAMSIRFYNDNFWKKYADRYPGERLFGIPTYLIINKNGEIINYDAPRPSRKDSLYQIIDKEI